MAKGVPPCATIFHGETRIGSRKSLREASLRRYRRDLQYLGLWRQYRPVRGSGLFVGETGVEASHHFLLPEAGDPFHFIAGVYQLEVHARVLGENESRMLFASELDVSANESDLIGDQGSGLYFDWDPDEKFYTHHLKLAPKSFWDHERQQG